MMRIVKRLLQALNKSNGQSEVYNLYSQFMDTGDLCFDVGANIGNRTEIFLELGAKVVSIEPQEACFKILGRSYGNRLLNRLQGYNGRIFLVNKGLGEEEGYLPLHISETSVISTMSDKWMREGRFSNKYNWSETQLVSITTLDKLILKYGLPKFCKIDVEGFEYPVLKGLTKPIPFISFEFTKEFFDDAQKCIDHLLSIGHAEFNFSIAESHKLYYSKWVTQEELYEALSSFDDDLLWGDIYVKFA